MEPLRYDNLRLETAPQSRWRDRLWREACFARAVLRQRGVSLLVFAALLAVGTILFLVLEAEKQHEPVRALHFTFGLVFGQTPPEFPRAWPLRVLYFAAPLLGLTVLIEAVVEVSRMIRDRRLNEQEWSLIMASSMKDHVILVGLGRVGIRTFHMLRKLGAQVVVLERRDTAAFLDDVRRDGSPVVVGDARSEALLEEVGVRDARSIVISTDDDLANLEIALDARKLNPRIRVVMRMFDPNMAEKVREGFNIKTVMSVAALAAPTFALAALERGIVDSTIVDDFLVVTKRVQARAGDALCGRTVAEILRQHHVGVTELRSSDGARVLFPPPEAAIRAGDEVLVQGEYDALERLFASAEVERGSAGS